MNKSEEVVEQIIYEFANNWDIIIDTLGQDIADMLDDAHLEAQLNK